MYTVRPSIITSSLFASAVLKPRALIAQSCEFFCATCRLSANRSASGMLVAPERRMSSCVMTWIADAVPSSFSGWRDTEVTSTFISSSTLSCLSSPMLEALSARTCDAAQPYRISALMNQFRLIIPVTFHRPLNRASCDRLTLRPDCPGPELGQTLKHKTCEYVLRFFLSAMLATLSQFFPCIDKHFTLQRSLAAHMGIKLRFFAHQSITADREPHARSRVTGSATPRGWRAAPFIARTQR